jgi:hypothetical protein
MQPAGSEEMTQAELLNREMLAAGGRLLAALSAEEELTTRYYTHPNDETLLQSWRESRRAVERLANEYVAAIDGYRDFQCTRIVERNARGAHRLYCELT